MDETTKQNLKTVEEWSGDVFQFAEDALGMKASEPIDELRGKPIKYTDKYGREQTTLLFDMDGRLVYHDLSFYTVDMFKYQDKKSFKNLYRGSRFTWQQTVELEAYNRAIKTFNQDSYDVAKRWITIRSGHGCGKTSFLAVISLHFLICFFGSQAQITANTENQLKDVFMKEFSIWRQRVPDWLRDNIDVLDSFIRVVGSKDWFLRARVASPEKPEALAGLHGKYVLNLVDEASAVSDKPLEVIKGALTSENYIVVYTSNPTRTEGEFFESHKDGSMYTKIHLNSRHSPIVKDGYITKMEHDYGKDSDEVRVRVDGDFPSTAEMDDKGWIPLFANVTVMFEPESTQILSRPIIACDPAGQGKDRSEIVARDAIYLKNVLTESTSNEVDLARKIETIREAYIGSYNDVGVEAFGVGAKVVANIRARAGESPTAILTDKPREETKNRFHTYKSELAWKFREWCLNGGIIISNNSRGWLRELDKIKYRRDLQGRIQLMGKVEFKKEHGFSPDKFDAAIHSFFKDEPTMPVHLTKEQLEQKEIQDWLQKSQMKSNTSKGGDNYSSM